MTPEQRADLVALVALIAELERPSNNTEAELVRRSGLPEETVAWCLGVLLNDGKGWLTIHEHPKTGEQGYLLNARSEKEDVEHLFKRWSAVQKAAMTFDGDEDDPEDEWNEGVYE